MTITDAVILAVLTLGALVLCEWERRRWERDNPDEITSLFDLRRGK